MSEMIYGEKTAIIRGGLFAVQNEVGLGRNEEIYHQAFCRWLDHSKIPYISKKAHHLMLGDEIAFTLYPDVVVWDCISIELKALSRHLQDDDRVQLFNYLKRRGDQLGLLVNMGLDRVHVERFVYETPDYSFVENWDTWDGCTSEQHNVVGQSLRQAMLSIFEKHQTGYGRYVVDNLMACALRRSKLSVLHNPSGQSMYRGGDLGSSPLDCMIVENELVVTYTALFDTNDFNIHRGLSFMKSLKIPFGLAINFGKRSLAINALALPSPIRGTPLASVGSPTSPAKD